MPAILIGKGELARQMVYEREKDFEADVLRLSDQIFGTSALYVDVKKRVGNDIVSIPDGYVLDTAEPDDPRLFVVENEIVEHDPFKHIGIQMLRFVTSFEQAQRAIRMFLMDSIKRSAALLKRLEAAQEQSTSPNIDHYLDRAVYSEFKGVVIIDEAKTELFHVIGKINANISVLQLRAFETDSGKRIYEFDTLYDEYEDSNVRGATRRGAGSAAERAARQARRANSDTIVVPAWDEGFEEVFLGKNRWYAIRISAAMKDRIKYIAAYRVAPISAVTHLAEIADIRPYRDTGKYVVVFRGPARKIRQVKLTPGRNGPQGPVYVRKDRLLASRYLEDALTG